MDKAEKYISDVISGKILTCKYVKLAVERHLQDLKNCKEKGIYFDKEAGLRAIKFCRFVNHTKGEWGGKSLELEGWQAFCDYVIFGWKNNDGTRRFNYAYIEVARKNGKSTWASKNALYFLDADNEPAAEVYCFATKEEQAKKTIFAEAKNMVKKSPFLSRRLNTYAKSIFSDITLSFFQPLGSDSDTQDGLNTHAGICDEYHAHKDDSMFNVIKSSMGSRLNPMMWTITTAGFNIESACYHERETCIKILEGIIEQDNKFAIIYTLDKDDDWQDQNNWVKANPNLGVSVYPKYLKNEFKDSINNPTRINNFKTKHLNIWVKQTQDFISDEQWMLCAGEKLLPNEFWNTCKGRICHAGLDISKRIDLNAFSLLFTDKLPFDLYTWFWIPESKVEQNRDRVNYQKWADEGWLKILPGEAIDMDILATDIIDIIRQVNIFKFQDKDTQIHSIGCDPAYMEMGVAKKLSDEGIIVNQFRQGFISMGPPTGEFLAHILEQKINHNGNPVLRWNNSNVAIRTDPAGNIKVDKEKSTEKVDGIVASIMALGEYLTFKENESIYEKHGLRIL